MKNKNFQKTIYSIFFSTDTCYILIARVPNIRNIVYPDLIASLIADIRCMSLAVVLLPLLTRRFRELTDPTEDTASE
jgi:hypothetical protein